MAGDGTVSISDAAGSKPAVVVAADLPAGQGVLHVIDNVLLPRTLASMVPGAAPQPAPAQPASGAGRAAASLAALAAALLAALLH